MHAFTFFMDHVYFLTQLSDLSLSLFLSVSSLHSRCPHPALLQEFSFTQVWYSNQQPVHCAFSLQRHSASTTQLSCKISVRQVKGHEQLLQVYTSVGEVRFTLMSSLCLRGLSLFSQPHVYFFLKTKKKSLFQTVTAYCDRLSRFKKVYDEQTKIIY